MPGRRGRRAEDGEVVDAAAGVLSTPPGRGRRRLRLPDRLDHQAVDDARSSCSSSTRAARPRRADARLPARVPASRDEAAAAAITTRQLLTHTAGFEGDIFTDTGRGDDAVEKYVGVARRPPPALRARRAVLLQQRRVLRARPARRGAARASRTTPALVEHIVDPARPHPRRHEPVRGDPVPRRRRSRRAGEDGDREPAPVWALARSNAPAGSMLAMRPRDLLGFARMHLDDGARARRHPRAGAESVPAMQHRAGRPAPTSAGMGDAWGLGWELFDTPQGTVIGHDGGTIGQAAFLRVVPEAGVAVALLTNGGDVFGLFNDVVGHDPRASSPASRCRPARCRRPSPQRSTPAASSAPTPTPSTTSPSARTTTAGSGSTARRRTSSRRSARSRCAPSSSHFADDSLIAGRGRPRHPRRLRLLGSATAPAHGKRKYLHYGRVVARAD